MPITPPIETFANLDPLLFIRPKLNAAIEAVNTALQPEDVGTAAAEDVSFFATAAQGALADTSVQPGDDATVLSSGAAAENYVLTADGAGVTSWQIPYSEFDGASIDTLAKLNAWVTDATLVDVAGDNDWTGLQTFTGGTKDVWGTLSGSSVVVNRGNWDWSITEDSVASIVLEEGDSATVQVGPADTFGITWYAGAGSPAGSIEWIPGDSPHLSADSDSLILLWNKGGVIYGLESLQMSGSAAVFIASSPPENPRSGDLWFDEVEGGLYMQYDSQWISTSTSPTVHTALRTFSGGIVVEGEVRETVIVDNSGAAYTVDIVKGTIFDLTLDAANAVLTFPAPIAGRQFTLFAKQDAIGGRMITWDESTVKWAGDSAPELTGDAGATDVFSFICDGTYWLGFVGGMNYLRV